MAKHGKAGGPGESVEGLPDPKGSQEKRERMLAALKKADKLRERMRREGVAVDVVELIREVRESR